MPRKASGERATDSPAASRNTTTTTTPTPRRVPRAAKKSAATSVASATVGLTDEQIRERAYFIYLERNGGPGDPIADWHQAERELRDSARGTRS